MADATQAKESTQKGSRNSTILGLLAMAWIALALYLLFWFDVSSGIPTSDNFGHGVLFVFIAATVATIPAVRASRLRLFGLIIGLAALAGLAELAQDQLTQDRSPEWSDFASGSLGSVLGVGVIGLLGAGYRRWFEPAVILGSGGALVVLVAGVVSSSIGLPERIQCRSVGTTIEGVEQGAVSGEVLRIHQGTIVGPEGFVEASAWGANPPTSTDEGLQFAEGQFLELPADFGESLYCSTIGHNDITIVAEISPISLDQTGPARILTMSEGIDRHQIDLHIAQQADGLSIRIRTSAERLFTTTVPGLFTSTSRQRFAVVIAEGQLRILVDGILVHEESIRSETIRGWELDRPVLIGNEVGGGRSFEGEISLLSVYRDELTPEQVGQVFEVADAS